MINEIMLYVQDDYVVCTTALGQQAKLKISELWLSKNHCNFRILAHGLYVQDKKLVHTTCLSNKHVVHNIM